MPRALPPLLLTLAVAAPLGCTGRTAPLDGLRFVSGADGGLSEGPILDSGGLDAGFFDATGPSDTGPGGACTYAGTYQQDVRVSQGDAVPQGYDGIAVLLSRDPLDFELGRGPVVRISLGNAPLPADLMPGSVVWLQYGTDTPQWTNTAIAIREIAPNDGPGRVRLAAWAYGEEEVDLEEEFDDISLRYEVDDCTPSRIACGPARTVSLIVDGPGVGSRVGAGEVQFFRTMEVGNGQSHEYDPFPECTDTPFFWHEGYVAVF